MDFISEHAQVNTFQGHVLCHKETGNRTKLNNPNLLFIEFKLTAV